MNFEISKEMFEQIQTMLTSIDNNLFIKKKKYGGETEYRIYYRSDYYAREYNVLVGNICSKGVYNYRHEYRKTRLTSQTADGLFVLLRWLEDVIEWQEGTK